VAQTAVTDALAETFVIEGGRPLGGRVRAAGNKNGALPVLAACLLTTEPVVLSNVPRIRDVETMIALISALGADVEWIGQNEVRVHAADVSSYELDPELARRIRASFLLAGPLLARLGRASVPPPGGDVIGRRRLDPHIHALAELGAEIDIGDRFELRTAGLRGKHIFLDEASVMATENTVMAAVLTPGETVIGNAACEPHIQDLCRFLGTLGAQIEGIESNVLRIKGVESLSGGEWRICPEHIEVGSFVGLAAVTGGDVTIDGVEPKDLAAILPIFERLGVHVEVEGTSLRVPPEQELVIRDDLGGQIPKIEDGPWPAFPADLTSIAVTVATQARGTVLIFEKMFESRLFFVDKLVSMGARIILCDPHRAVVTGPTKLYGQQMSSPDIRAMAIRRRFSAGESTIGAVHQIDKGMSGSTSRAAIGARIERRDSDRGMDQQPPSVSA
jgi:UDP-N-acetylglucosamine 1-carboxyvinyltransferase